MNNQSGARKAYKLLTGSDPILPEEPEYNGMALVWCVVVAILLFAITMIATCSPNVAHADNHNKITVMFRPNCFPIIGHTCSELADAIYKAENSKTYPYGIMKKYRKITPRQACLNTIKSGVVRWLKTDQKEDFIVFLGRTYSPPENNPDWVRLVKYFLKKGDNHDYKDNSNTDTINS